MAVALAAAAAQTTEKGIPAFPGAEGFGATTPGGRGGRVIEVANLNSSGPGSLNAAGQAKGPRIVLFRVSGAIEGSVRVTEPYITIAGQTAPGDGICIRNGLLSVSTHDVIIRHLRVRPGDALFGPTPSDRDGLHIGGSEAYNIVIDHCSVSWGIDENMSVTGGPHDVTIQWCITSEALFDSLHFKGPHSMGMLAGRGVNGLSVLHTLFAFNYDRNPLLGMKGSRTRGVFDLRNNVIYQPDGGYYPYTSGGGNLEVNYVGNCLKTAKTGEDVSRAFWVFPYGGAPKFYLRDNVWPRMPKGQDARWSAAWDISDGKRGPIPVDMRSDEPAPAPAVATDSAAQAYERVLSFAGCTQPVRDVVDARVVADVRDRGGRFIHSPMEVGGWPTYASTPAPADRDHDGMPDAWEKRLGFDSTDPADGSRDRDGDGYTNVEEFLNETDPTAPDSGVALPQKPVEVQAGNDHIRGPAARKAGDEYLATLKTPNAAAGSREAFIKKIRGAKSTVADVLGIKFVGVEPGVFRIGKAEITLIKPYEISAYEVTQAQWETVMGTRPWSGQPGAEDDPSHPASYINYIDAQEFISRLNAGGDRAYRLPTRCEWVWAARGGTDSPYGFGRDTKALYGYAWCACAGQDGRSHRPNSPQSVGRLKPNPWGLYDMAGNVAEWVQDWSWRAKRDATDPKGPERGTCRHYCGGYFLSPDYYMLRIITVATRPHHRRAGIGFRLCRERRLP